MNATALRSVPLNARREIEELVLRPVIVFAEVEAKEPPSVIVDRRRPRQCGAAAKPWRDPRRTKVVVGAGDLLAWLPSPRPPRRAPRIRPKRATPVQAPPATPDLGARPPIRSRRLRRFVPRKLREGARPESLGSAPLTRKERRFLQDDLRWLAENGGVELGPPATFGECPPTGPCVRVSCRHHAYLEVDGPIVKLNFPDLEPQDLAEPCTLRIAIRAAHATESCGLQEQAMAHREVSKLLNLTPESTRLIEVEGLKKLKRRARRLVRHED